MSLLDNENLAPSLKNLRKDCLLTVSLIDDYERWDKCQSQWLCFLKEQMISLPKSCKRLEEVLKEFDL